MKKVVVLILITMMLTTITGFASSSEVKYEEYAEKLKQFNSSEGNIGKLPQITTRDGHTLAIDTNGTLWGWGKNDKGQLGDGTKEDRLEPVKIMDNVAAISAGRFFSLAIKTDGTLWSWGDNYFGKLGDGTTENRLSPVKIMDDVATISAGRWHSLAIKTDGTLWAWGRNYEAELGDGLTENRLAPVKIMDNVATISAGNSHSQAIKTDGTLWTWGMVDYGQIMEDRTPGIKLVQRKVVLYPVKIMDDVVMISGKDMHNLAVKTDGTLWGWGWNEYGELGSDINKNITEPIKIMENVEKISTGTSFSLVKKTDGTLWGWGRNYNGKLGDGTNEDRLTPVKIMDNVEDFSGYWGSFAIKADGTLWAWGYLVGDGTEEKRLTPVKIMDLGKYNKATSIKSDVIINYENYAEKLKQIGVFKGTSSGFELDREPTRIEAAVMFVRLLGAEQEALEKKYEHPFKDVPEWASAYVGYLYHEKLSNGVDETTFGASNNIQAKSYVTFILRALGYNDSEGDFSWGESLEFAKGKGVINDADFNELNIKSFLRDHVANVSYKALQANLKGKETTLVDKLVDIGAIDEETAKGIGLMSEAVLEPTTELTP